ncbi:tautomerase family protein [Catellatospora sp. TT07R-123]|uniref:tautomerase family protein n=1 Tax=Catellatospora sp. TT07R-123 TaxID=2733863 RepID=UPI001BB2F84D|nr:tautomerase family protein [Catellatospora sp. TT07R-123]
MAQVKIYGRRAHLAEAREAMSDAIHGCAVAVLGLPQEKRFHRFIGLDPEDFVHPADRSERYTVIEVSMFEGRTTDTRKRLIRELFTQLETRCGLSPQDVEITIFETPRHNWGIRGRCGDELELSYDVSR